MSAARLLLLPFLAVAGQVQEDAWRERLRTIEAPWELLEDLGAGHEEERTLDLGRVEQGEPLLAVFRFLWKGERPLVLEEVRPNCGCLGADVVLAADGGGRESYAEGEAIVPGTAFEVRVGVDTRGMGGRFHKTVDLVGGRPEGVLRLLLDAFVERRFVVEPPSLRLEGLSKEERASGAVRVRSTRGPVRFQALLEGAPASTEVELVPLEPDDEGRSEVWEVRVRVGPGLAEREHRFRVRLPSDVPAGDDHAEEGPGIGRTPVHEASVPVLVRVLPPVTVEPTFLSFGKLHPGDAVERRIRVRSNDGRPLTPPIGVSVRTTFGEEHPRAEAFAWSVEELEAGRAYEVVLRVQGLGDVGTFGGRLHLSLGHPAVPEEEIPFSGVCRAAPGG